MLPRETPTVCCNPKEGIMKAGNIRIGVEESGRVLIEISAEDKEVSIDLLEYIASKLDDREDCDAIITFLKVRAGKIILN